ncbi:hypothetical protein HA402_011024 [Bradysia odoriphaga]|nr:hypothetical protein HA402_011024 [Bradysia odoriphaga]
MAEGPLAEPITSDDSNSPEVKAFRKLISENVATLFGSDLFSDLTIVVGEKMIKAHKICLACKGGSPVFKAMLSTDWTESDKSIVHIKDFDYETVMQMLEFVYTSRAPKISDMADRLLEIAEKYNIGILKAKCERVLIRTICVNNVLQLLLLAERNGANKLEDAALNFLKWQYKQVRETEMWNEMRQNNSQIFEKIADFSFGYVSPKKPRRL